MMSSVTTTPRLDTILEPGVRVLPNESDLLSVR
jgi:hypothetical protein